MALVIVPDTLDLAINEKLEAAFKAVPDAESCRAHLYHQLLDFYNENGYLPEFSLVKADRETEL